MKRAAACLLTLCACGPGAVSRTSSQTHNSSRTYTLTVEGNTLVSSSHETVHLRGVNLSGSEFRCVKGDGIFDGPAFDELVKGLTTWNVNAVRMPLNESCWLGDERLKPELSGATYRSEIVKRVNQFRALGWYVIVDLHWSSVGDDVATGIAPLPHGTRSPAFWTSVAQALLHDEGVVFDLYNEPHPHLQGAAAWKCWRDGCVLDHHAVAGMQNLVDAVRATGAHNIVLTSGLDWSNDLSQWAAYRPHDARLAISFHTYNFNKCITASCWSALPHDVPLVITEFGENDCSTEFVKKMAQWADARGASYLAWTWNRWDCKKGPALIEAWDGTPTPYGKGVRDAFSPHRPLSLGARDSANQVGNPP